MEQREIAIRLSGVKKMYKLGQIGGGTLRADLQSWWARKRGKEDPNTKIGAERLIGQTFMALNGIDLTVYQGEALGIIGGNGAGKSTMLKLLSRVTAPTAGKIELNGRVASMLEVGTGFNGEMTGRENIYMNGAILGMTKAEIDAKMEDIIEFSEVRDFIDTPVKRYSSGMYVKLAFSVAAHLDSEIMIMDEVLAVGDMAFQKKCLDKMREAAKKQGRTVLYVSHNMNTIRQLCDRCVVLDKGKVVFEGDVEEAISLYLGGGKQKDVVTKLSEIPHDSFGDSKMWMQSVEMLSGNTYISENEALRLRLAFSSRIDCPETAFRLILFTESGTPVGMAASDAAIRAVQGDNEVDLTVSFPHLAGGTYSARLALYEVDTFGNEVIHDVVDRAFTFEKMTRENENDTAKTWKHRIWGGIVFPTVMIDR